MCSGYKYKSFKVFNCIAYAEIDHVLLILHKLDSLIKYQKKVLDSQESTLGKWDLYTPLNDFLSLTEIERISFQV